MQPVSIRQPRRPPTVIVVDDFLDDPDSARRLALSLNYQADNRYFRGQRSTTPVIWPGMKEEIERLLQHKIVTKLWNNHATNGVFQFCVGGDQIVYHSDENYYAAVLYLTPNAPPEAGTKLFRSRANRCRSVQEAMGGKFLGSMMVSAIQTTMYQGKLLDPTAWEEVDSIGNRYNRLVIWNAQLVHAAGCYFGDSMETGRLFQMFFFDLET
jgi:hypothetical protein